MPADRESSLEARLQQLLAANHAALRRMVASYVRSPEDQKDLQQEIALAVWRSLPGFRGDCSEKTFLLRIAHNRCLTFLHRQRKSVSLESSGVDPQDRRPHAEDRAVREEEKEGLLQAVRSLPLVYREIVLLALEELDYREISEVVGISESNVGARLSRARQQLREVLEVRREQRC